MDDKEFEQLRELHDELQQLRALSRAEQRAYLRRQVDAGNHEHAAKLLAGLGLPGDFLCRTPVAEVPREFQSSTTK